MAIGEMEKRIDDFGTKKIVSNAARFSKQNFITKFENYTLQCLEEHRSNFQLRPSIYDFSTIDFTSRGKTAAFVSFVCQLRNSFSSSHTLSYYLTRERKYSAQLYVLTLVVAILVGRGKQRFKFGADFWISVILSLIAILSGIFRRYGNPWNVST